ncbi:ferredoxin [Patescibacteria group bacterium]|nr:MAG: ferredoxin [Patescibacteria group bacterium]
MPRAPKKPPEKYAKNAPGAWCVTDKCVACIKCTLIVPTVFWLDPDNGGYAYVRRQPIDEEEEADCREAQRQCPLHAIQHKVSTP